MNTKYLCLLSLTLTLAACDRGAEQRAAEQREADARAQKEVAAQNAEERRRLDDEQAALAEERRQLQEEKANAREEGARRRIREEEERLAKREAALRKEEAAAQAAAERREREVAQQAQRAEEQKLDFFYTALDPLGDWLEVEPYGYCWQPREARDPRWRPYTEGTWVFTEYGWTWKGNEPFGWATYHYGRWARLRGQGWVWVPGSEWAPAWVSWRRGGEYVGWAPLPPEAYSQNGFNGAVDSYYDIGPAAYTFVPVSRLGEGSYRAAAVEPERNVTIINQTVNVTNIQYNTVQQQTAIYNGGPDLAKINRESARPIQRLRVERESRAPQAGGGGTNVVGDVLRLAAPLIAPAARGQSAPAKVKERGVRAEVERGWDGGDREVLRSFRERQREEAAQVEQQERSGRPPRGRGERDAGREERPRPNAPNSLPAVPARTTPAAVKAAPVSTPVPATPAARPVPPKATPRPTATARPATPQPPAPAATPEPKSAPAATPTPGRQRPGGERPGGERPGGERPGGERPGGERPGGERPGGERPGRGRTELPAASPSPSSAQESSVPPTATPAGGRNRGEVPAEAPAANPGEEGRRTLRGERGERNRRRDMATPAPRESAGATLGEPAPTSSKDAEKPPAQSAPEATSEGKSPDASERPERRAGRNLDPSRPPQP